MGSLALTMVINKKVINKYLTDATYNTKPESVSKFRISGFNAIYDNKVMAGVDHEEKTFQIIFNAELTDYAKTLQNMIRKQAIELGYTEEKN